MNNREAMECIRNISESITIPPELLVHAPDSYVQEWREGCMSTLDLLNIITLRLEDNIFVF